MQLITPEWPAPDNVKAIATTRLGGVSQGCYSGLNLGDHVGDDPANVRANRQLLAQSCELKSEPFWLRQTHSTIVHEFSNAHELPEGDASFSCSPHQACVVMTADCLPVLLTDVRGTQVAAIHAGWRGLADGIIESTLQRFTEPAVNLMAWLGPCIGPSAFEIGLDVAEQIGGPDAAYMEHADSTKRYANLPLLAAERLNRCGVKRIVNSNFCTFSQADFFFSYRRDGQTGRMATMIWLTS